MKKENEFSRAAHATQRLCVRAVARDVAHAWLVQRETARGRGGDPARAGNLAKETSNFTQIIIKY